MTNEDLSMKENERKKKNLISYDVCRERNEKLMLSVGKSYA